MLYRKPGYLICTDNGLDIEKLLQAYIWRWEIEVNFREEKTTNGCGDAQVRNEISSAKLPAFVVAMHAFLHLADHILSKKNANQALPKAKWEQAKPEQRASTNNLLNLFRGHYWYGKLGKYFSDFVTKQHQTQKGTNPLVDCCSAVFYMRK